MTNIKNIINYFSKYDTSSADIKSIDTMLEYERLGEYLNGNYRIENTDFNNLSKKSQNKLIEIYKNAKNRLADFFNNKNDIPKITNLNIEKYLNLFYNLQNRSQDDNTNASLEKLKLGICAYIEENGINTDPLKLKGDDSDIEKIIEFIHDGLVKTKFIDERNKKTFRLIEKPYEKNHLKNFANTYIKNEHISPLNEPQGEIDLGNGLFDKVPKQQAGNCWLHAGINSLLNTEQGKELLESNRYYDSTTGVFVIHLQEAEDNNLHDGIYIITPDDIKNRSKDLSMGEGDVTAYIIAVEKYFEEANSNNIKARPKQFDNIGRGNHAFRFFEIITGGEKTSLRTRKYNPTIPFSKGISWQDSNDIAYDELYDMIANDNGACVVAIRNTKNEGHALSIIGVKNGNLLIQESNSQEDFHETYEDENGNQILYKSEDLNGAPTFELTKENYKYLSDIGILKFS